jgi:hypothetical protein
MKFRLRCVLPARSLRSAGVAVFFASLVWAQVTPAGHWQGAFTTNNRETSLSLDLAKNEQSVWIASMGLPNEFRTDTVVTNLAVDGNTVRFVAVELQRAEFALILGSDGRMKGSVSIGPNIFPVQLKRTGEAKVKLILPSPAVSKELEGDWEGPLEAGSQTVRVAVSFKNQSNRTVVGTFQGAPLNDMKQNGQTVEFGIKVANSSFRGTLNPEGTVLTGQLTQDGVRRPLRLRKK